MLGTRHASQVLSMLETRPLPVLPATLEDFFQKGASELLREMRSGVLAGLSDFEQRDLALYFLRLRERRLGEVRNARLNSVLVLRKLSRTLGSPGEPPDPRAASAPGSSGPREILNDELRKLSSLDRRVLVQALAGVPYSRIAQETGQNALALQEQVSRTKRDLALRLAQASQAARPQNFNELREG